MNSRRLHYIAVLVAALFVLGTSAVIAKQDKVLVCHATSSEANPYVTLEVPANEGGYPQGHYTENGTPKAGHEDDYLGACPEPSPPPSQPPSAPPSSPPSAPPSTPPTEPPPTVEPSATPTLPPPTAPPTAQPDPDPTPVPSLEPTPVPTPTPVLIQPIPKPPVTSTDG
jgi:outer membrane biosynthesis protein TonB